MKQKAPWKPCAIAAAGLVILAAAAGAQVQSDPPQLVIPAGLDIWTTPDDGATHVTVVIPGDFFCVGTPAKAETVTIALKGKSLATSPANVLGTTDTVVYRSQAAAFDDNTTATVPIEVVGLSLVGSAQYTACGQSYTVQVCRAPSQPPGSLMSITLNGSGNGGTFNATLDVEGLVWFKNANGTLGPLTDTVYLTTVDAHWANQVGSNGIDYSGSVQLDQNCSGQPSGPSYPGTSGFHPGWSWTPPPSHWCSPQPCQVPTPHEGPHRTIVPRPVKRCPSAVDIVVQLNEVAVYSAASTSTSLEFTVIQPCQIQITDAVVADTDGANCTTGDLEVKVEGSTRGFSVVSRDPCVLDL